jgi:hypothetical protein
MRRERGAPTRAKKISDPKRTIRPTNAVRRERGEPTRTKNAPALSFEPMRFHYFVKHYLQHHI